MKTKPVKSKRTHECVVRTSISMPPILWDAATNKQRTAGYPSFSDYIQNLIRLDALGAPK